MTYIRSNVPPTGREDQHILLVDDNELNRRMIERILRAFGITQICHASDGREALETARLYFRPNVIITDWDMKPMNGLAFVAVLRTTQPSSANIPVVMVSTRTGESAVRAAMDAGVDEYLTKPVNPAALYTVLARVTGNLGIGKASVAPRALPDNTGSLS